MKTGKSESESGPSEPRTSLFILSLLGGAGILSAFFHLVDFESRRLYNAMILFLILGVIVLFVFCIVSVAKKIKRE